MFSRCRCLFFYPISVGVVHSCMAIANCCTSLKQVCMSYLFYVDVVAQLHVPNVHGYG